MAFPKITRKDRKRAKIAHLKSQKQQNVTRLVTPHTNLFDEIYSKQTANVQVKCAGIYDSVFCKG